MSNNCIGTCYDEDVEPVSKKINCNDTVNDCGICMEQLLENDKYITQCNHIFHKECINKWLQIKDNCPYCRTIQTNIDVNANIDENIYRYSFALYPESYEPSGSIRSETLVTSYNWLRIYNGMSGLSYTS